jgi:hypothetical protein
MEPISPPIGNDYLKRSCVVVQGVVHDMDSLNLDLGENPYVFNPDHVKGLKTHA